MYFCSGFDEIMSMFREKLYHIIEWVIAITACVFLIWKLATYNDYAALNECLRGMGWRQWLAIGVCVALMPVNMSIEAWRWRTLMNGQGARDNGQWTRDDEQGTKDKGQWTMDNGQWTKDDRQGTQEMSWREAHRQVYYSKLAGLITPWRLGEYPARGLLMVESIKPKASREKSKEIMTRVVLAGVVGSATMTVAIVIAGLVALCALGVSGELGQIATLAQKNYLLTVGGVLALIVLGLALWTHYTGGALDMTDGQFSVDQKPKAGLVIKNTFQSVVRVMCWCVQLGLVIWALNDPEMASGGLWGIGFMLLRTAVCYLFVTVTPNVPIAEVGIRGAWAIVVFGTVNAALAGVLLWAINTLMPCLLWFFIRKKR